MSGSDQFYSENLPYFMESLGKQQLYRHPRKNHTSTSIHAAGVGGPGCDQRLPVHTQPEETALHDGTG